MKTLIIKTLPLKLEGITMIKRGAMITLGAIILIAMGTYVYLNQKGDDLSDAIFTSVASIGITDMSRPASIQITEQTEINEIIKLLDVNHWTRLNEFDWDYAPGNYHMLVGGVYVLSIGEWDEESDICFVSKRNDNDMSYPCGKYLIPKTVIQKLDEYAENF